MARTLHVERIGRTPTRQSSLSIRRMMAATTQDYDFQRSKGRASVKIYRPRRRSRDWNAGPLNGRRGLTPIHYHT